MRLFAILLLLWLPLGIVRAQGDIHRCVGANGAQVFTDRVCADVNATPAVPAPTPTSSVSNAPMPIAEPPPVLCASDLGQLKQAVVDAFAARNPNRLAGLMLWDGDGDGRQAVVADIRLYARLMAHPLVEVSTGGAAAPHPASSAVDQADPSELSMGATPGPRPAQGETLSIQTETDDGSGAAEGTRFSVVRHAGCLWLEPQF